MGSKPLAALPSIISGPGCSISGARGRVTMSISIPAATQLSLLSLVGPSHAAPCQSLDDIPRGWVEAAQLACKLIAEIADYGLTDAPLCLVERCVTWLEDRGLLSTRMVGWATGVPVESADGPRSTVEMDIAGSRVLAELTVLGDDLLVEGERNRLFARCERLGEDSTLEAMRFEAEIVAVLEGDDQ